MITFLSFISQVATLCAVFASAHATALFAAPIVSTGVSSSTRTQDVSSACLLCFEITIYVDFYTCRINYLNDNAINKKNFTGFKVIK